MSKSSSDVKSHNIIERAKEEIEAIGHHKKPSHHHKETHGTRNDIDENTPVNDVKAPNMFERAKEEIEALVHTVHPKKETQTNGARKAAEVQEQSKTITSTAENNVKTSSSIDTSKEHSEAIMKSKKSPVHHKETHGTSDAIDENTSIDEVKAPNVFERAKEEIEALVQTIQPKKDHGFGSFFGKWLEKACNPWGNNTKGN